MEMREMKTLLLAAASSVLMLAGVVTGAPGLGAGG
jgi:hypothetical protein